MVATSRKYPGMLTVGAMDIAFALDGGAGAISTGKMVGLFGLGKATSIGLMLRVTVGVNFLAGMGGYATKTYTNPTMRFNAGQMFRTGVGQASKATVNFNLSGIMSAVGFWGFRNMETASVVGIQGVFTRTIIKNTLTFLPYSIIESMFVN